MLVIVTEVSQPVVSQATDAFSCLATVRHSDVGRVAYLISPAQRTGHYSITLQVVLAVRKKNGKKPREKKRFSSGFFPKPQEKNIYGKKRKFNEVRI